MIFPPFAEDEALLTSGKRSRKKTFLDRSVASKFPVCDDVTVNFSDEDGNYPDGEDQDVESWASMNFNQRKAEMRSKGAMQAMNGLVQRGGSAGSASISAK